ncbi:unnamed protein product [Rotaria sp. Silwood2]|nr:unnamed protein product [Rotaria sp. Silwood2]CAF4594680.1 unnamed protein product [Rotaria sp. Silwood2]
MPSVISQTASKKNGLPDDIFDYNHDQFYTIIEQTYGVDLAELISFQSIRNGEHLLQASSDDILLILRQDSDDLSALKKMCCFQVVGNNYEIKLGVKLAVNNLIHSLKMKQEQQKKKKRRPTQRLPSLASHLDVTAVTNQTQMQDEISSPESSLLGSLASRKVSDELQEIHVKENSNEIRHQIDIEQRINKWWSKANEDEDLSLDVGIDYSLEINKSLNNTYACILTCKCGVRFKLPYLMPGLFKLSAFYRHIKEKQCVKVSKTGHQKEDDSISNNNLTTSHSNSSDHFSKPLSKKSQNNKASTRTNSKRLRSPSIQTSSTNNDPIVKKNRPLPLNTILLKKLGFVTVDGNYHLRLGCQNSIERLLLLVKSKKQALDKNFDVLDNNVENDIVKKLKGLFKHRLDTSNEIDVPFLVPLIKNIFENLEKMKNKYSYDYLIQQFALSLFILGGRNCYEFVRLNLPGAIPHISNIQSLTKE